MNSDPTALIYAHLDGELTDAGRRELNVWLEQDPAHVDRFVTECRLHSELCDMHVQRGAGRGLGTLAPGEVGAASVGAAVELPHQPGAPAPEPLIPPIVIDTSPFASPASFVGGWLFSYAAATVLTGMAILGAWAYKVSHDYQLAAVQSNRESIAPGDGVAGGTNLPKPESVGRITGRADCRWADAETAALGRTASVPLGGRYALDSGLLEITYQSGAKVILQGPCAYEVESSRGGFLSLGKVTARMETKGEGGRRKAEGTDDQKSPFPLPPSSFVVRTPTALVTDLGTEFGVEVTDEGTTTSHVFRGAVQMQPVADSGGQGTVGTMVLRENQSARLQRGSNRVAAVTGGTVRPAAFVRRMPNRLPSNLVSYWTFNEGQGTVAHNAGMAGRMYDGRLLAAASSGRGTLPAWTDGKFGRALKFSGATAGTYPSAMTSWSCNYVNVWGGGGVNHTNAATISTWVRWDGVQPVMRAEINSDAMDIYGPVIGRQKNGAFTDADFGLNYPGDPAACAGLRVGNSWTEGRKSVGDAPASHSWSMPENGSGFTAPGSNWVNIVMTIAPNDSTTYRESLYMNGVLLRTVTKATAAGQPDHHFTGNDASAPLTIGALYDDRDGYSVVGPSNSAVDDVGIFNVTLSEGEVKAIFNVPATAGLDDYDLSKVNTLFGVYDSADPEAAAVIGPLVWKKATNLVGHKAGDAWMSGGTYYVQLDLSGSGVAATASGPPRTGPGASGREPTGNENSNAGGRPRPKEGTSMN